MLSTFSARTVSGGGHPPPPVGHPSGPRPRALSDRHGPHRPLLQEVTSPQTRGRSRGGRGPAHRVQGPLSQFQTAPERQRQVPRDHGRNRGGAARQPPLRHELRARRLHLGDGQRLPHDPQHREARPAQVPRALRPPRAHQPGHRGCPGPSEAGRRRAAGHPLERGHQDPGGFGRQQDGQPGGDQEPFAANRAAGVCDHRPGLRALRRAQRPAGRDRPPHPGRRVQGRREPLRPERRNPAADHARRGAAGPRGRHPRGLVGDGDRSRGRGPGGPAQQRPRRGRRRQLLRRPVPLGAQRQRRKRARRLPAGPGQQVQSAGHHLPAEPRVPRRGRRHVRGLSRHDRGRRRRGHLHPQPGGHPRPLDFHQCRLGAAQDGGGRQRRLRPDRGLTRGALADPARGDPRQGPQVRLFRRGGRVPVGPDRRRTRARLDHRRPGRRPGTHRHRPRAALRRRPGHRVGHRPQRGRLSAAVPAPAAKNGRTPSVAPGAATGPAADITIARGGITASPGAASGVVFVAQKSADVLSLSRPGGPGSRPGAAALGLAAEPRRGGRRRAGRVCRAPGQRGAGVRRAGPFRGARCHPAPPARGNRDRGCRRAGHPSGTGGGAARRNRRRPSPSCKAAPCTRSWPRRAG